MEDVPQKEEQDIQVKLMLVSKLLLFEKKMSPVSQRILSIQFMPLFTFFFHVSKAPLFCLMLLLFVVNSV